MEYVREYEFAALIHRKWKFDFAWPNKSGRGGTAVAIDGGQYAYRGGRHATDDDKEKGNHAVVMGWWVLHFSGSMLQDPEAVCAMVRWALEAKR